MPIIRANWWKSELPRILQNPFPTIQPPANDPGQTTPDFGRPNLSVELSPGIAAHVQFQLTDRDISGLDIYQDWLDRQFDEEERRNTAAADAAAQASMWPCW